MSTASRLISFEDSLLLPEDKCDEIVKGELRKMPPPSVRHARLIARLARILRNQTSEEFEVLDSAFGQVIRREPFTYRVPDLGIYRDASLADDQYVSAVPELLVEVVSPTNRKGDLAELMEDYEVLGAPEVWIIEIDTQIIHRQLMIGGKFASASVVTEGSISPVRLPGVVVLLNKLFGF